MTPIRLEDLVPEQSSFKLSATGETYRVRPFSIDDELWLKRTFGDTLEGIFKEARMVELCQIAFHQLELEDQRKFSKRKVMLVNDDGEEQEHEIGGSKLLACSVSGWHEKVEMIQALTTAIGVSRKMLDQISEQEKKRTKTRKSTGPESSTDLAPNMDGQPSTAEP